MLLDGIATTAERRATCLETLAYDAVTAIG